MAMMLQSMTGFARNEGSVGQLRWIWEIRSVNGRGLDLRLRLPAGYDALEPVARKEIQNFLQRGNIQLSLNVSRDESQSVPVINEQALDAVIDCVERLKERIDCTPPTADGLLNIRGVLEFREIASDAETEAREREIILDGLRSALADLVAVRSLEGAKIAEFLSSQLTGIESLVRRVDDDPSRTPAAIAERLGNQVRSLLETGVELNEERLHAESAILAAKADLREEVDRLDVHLAAARQLLAEGGPIGRRLDFLAQEFNRECNTICSKSNATAVTTAGLEMKVIVDQFREQVQNLE